MKRIDYWKLKSQVAALSQLPILIHLAVTVPPVGL
jgi:hypothetical protein